MELETGAIIAGIIVGATILLMIIRQIIRHAVKSIQGDRVKRGLHLIRRGTPKVLRTSDPNVTLRRLQRATTIGALLRSASTVIIVVITGFLILDQLSVSLGPFVAGTAIATAALGFGAQNIVRDFLAGFFIVVEDQYGVGDFIDAGEAKGIVEHVSLRTTRIRGADGTLWHVPNGEIKRVGNKSQTWSKAVIEFRVDPSASVQESIAIIRTAAEAVCANEEWSPVILDDPEVWGPEEVTGDATAFKLIVKTKPLEQWKVARALRASVKEAFNQSDVKLAPSPAE